ncbi:hypothetical protein PBI_HARLEY_105 [Mycobacterium phage Harley]|nr:hypothetical protein I5H45_gp105 [Mycobacterium phage Harley]AXN53265.1 hypothetical protein PBI_HARLEY_105 [Mycobacterium phage Harley]
MTYTIGIVAHTTPPQTKLATERNKQRFERYLQAATPEQIRALTAGR